MEREIQVKQIQSMVYSGEHINKSVVAENSGSTRSWTEIDPATDSEPVQLPFCESTVGPQLPPMRSQSPADFFHLFCTNDLFDLLITETNRLAQIIPI